MSGHDTSSDDDPAMTPRKFCLAAGRTGRPCHRPAGWGTDHIGFGECKLHTGSTPAGKQRASKEAAILALRTLAVPVAGSPIRLLQELTEHARGVVIAAARLLTEADEDQVEVRLKVYLDSLERAARIAKPAADAKIDEAMVAMSERQTSFLHELLEVYASAVAAPDEARLRGLAAVAARIRERGAQVEPAAVH